MQFFSAFVNVNKYFLRIICQVTTDVLIKCISRGWVYSTVSWSQCACTGKMFLPHHKLVATAERHNSTEMRINPNPYPRHELTGKLIIHTHTHHFPPHSWEFVPLWSYWHPWCLSKNIKLWGWMITAVKTKPGENIFRKYFLFFLFHSIHSTTAFFVNVWRSC